MTAEYPSEYLAGDIPAFIRQINCNETKKARICGLFSFGKVVWKVRYGLLTKHQCNCMDYQTNHTANKGTVHTNELQVRADT